MKEQIKPERMTKGIVRNGVLKYVPGKSKTNKQPKLVWVSG